MINIKRCPFCGCEKINVKAQCSAIFIFMYYAECSYCGARSQASETEEIAEKKWNMRFEKEGGIE